MAKRASFVHGTIDGYKYCKPACKNCLAAYEASLVPADTMPVPFPKESQPPPMDNPLDIIHFLKMSRFNTVNIFQLRDEWVCEIKRDGDKFVGFGSTAEYAFADALRRISSTDPETGPLTMTYNQTSYETSASNGSGLADNEEPTNLDKIWQESGEAPSPALPNIENNATTAEMTKISLGSMQTRMRSFWRQQAVKLISGYAILRQTVSAALSTESLGGLSDGTSLHSHTRASRRYPPSESWRY